MHPEPRAILGSMDEGRGAKRFAAEILERVVTAGIRYVRGDVVESFHRVHVAVSDAGGREVAGAGDPERTTYFRSAAKPFQALPLVEDGIGERLGMTSEELAICCASHSAEPEHLRVVRRLLDRLDLEEDDLECGAHPPLRDEVAARLLREGRPFGPLHNNCSGKHAGMLALAVGSGWSVEGYRRPDHPVQERMRSEVAGWTEMPAERIRTGTDGCGVVSFAVPLIRMAAAFARLATSPPDRTGPAKLMEAMTAHPFLVAGTGRFDTVLMDGGEGRFLAKGGAEGVQCVAVLGRGLGVAVKVEDGATRATGPATLRVLEELDVLEAEDVEGLDDFRRPVVRNTRGEKVGHLEPAFSLKRTGASSGA